MTLVVTIGAAILPEAALTAAAVGTEGAVAGATLGATAGTLTAGSALAAGAVGTGALGLTGLAANEMLKGPAAGQVGNATTPKLAPGLNPAMSAAEASAPAAAANAAPLSGLGAIGSPAGAAPQQPTQAAAHGGIMHAKGGHIPLKNGAYIIPADVVSALGNGSSKAGAEFLRSLMTQIKQEAIKRQGVGAAKKHVA